MVRRVLINQYHAILEVIIWWIGGSRDGKILKFVAERRQNGQKRQKENDDWCMSTSRLLQFGVCAYPNLTHWSMLFDTHTWQIISYFKLVWERNCKSHLHFMQGIILLRDWASIFWFKLSYLPWIMNKSTNCMGEFDSTITTESGFLCTSIKHSIYFIHNCDVRYNFKQNLFFPKEIYRTRIQLLLKCSYPLTCYFEVT